MEGSSFTATTNLAALILGAIIIGLGLIDERRLAFWLGSLYLVLLILSRFLEYKRRRCWLNLPLSSRAA